MKKSIIYLALIAPFVTNAETHSLVEVQPQPQQQKSELNKQAASATVRVPHRGGGAFFEDFQTQADPENPVLPAGWLVFDLDGLTPSPNVAQFTEAWIALADFNDTENFTAMSTSWYSPAGQSNDWLITPGIMLGANTSLSWRALAQDAAYPDGYEVYVSTSTQDVAGCSANPAIFTIASENPGPDFTTRVINLNDEGYSDQMVHICYRNNSNDQFILVLDDVGLAEVLSDDVAIDAVAAPIEYTQVPEVLTAYDIPLVVDFTNNGTADQSNITVQAEIFLDGASQTIISSVYAGPLLPGAGDSVDLGPFSATEVGIYDVVYDVALDGVVDANPLDNMAEVLNVVEITEDVMARDDGIEAGRLGVGAGDGGYVGTTFEFTTAVTLSGVEFVYTNNNCDVEPPNACSLDGESTQVDVFELSDVTGLPDAMVASTEAHIIPVGAAEATLVEVAFTNNMMLPAGSYVFAVVEPVRTVSTFDTINISVSYSNDRFTAGTSWVDWPSNPNGEWTNSEDFGFSVSYFIRPKFVDTDLIYKNGFE